ncbi:hypothetical protein vseg_019587 [Gypsophila vaccaria]
MLELSSSAMLVVFSDDFGAAESGSRVAFRWGASFSAMLLLLLNLIGRRSGVQATLLALILVTGLPAVFFQILRGQFGCWVAFLSIAASYILPWTLPVARFLLFVVIPDSLAYELRESAAGGALCLLLSIVLIVTEVHAMGRSICTCNWRCLAYWFSMVLLFFFTILYICLEPW